MKNLFSLLTMILVVLLSVGCNKDDDDGGGGNGTGGSMDDLELVLTWDTEVVDLDLSLIGPQGCFVVPLVATCNGGNHSGDDLEGPGEERITFDDTAIDGSYVVTVAVIDVDVEVPFRLTIESRNDGETFEETIIDTDDTLDDGERIITFTKSGGNLTF